MQMMFVSFVEKRPDRIDVCLMEPQMAFSVSHSSYSRGGNGCWKSISIDEGTGNVNSQIKYVLVISMVVQRCLVECSLVTPLPDL
jgi:hypothetical protein